LEVVEKINVGFTHLMNKPQMKNIPSLKRTISEWAISRPQKGNLHKVLFLLREQKIKAIFGSHEAKRRIPKMLTPTTKTCLLTF
jgi:hypothetical protein